MPAHRKRKKGKEKARNVDDPDMKEEVDSDREDIIPSKPTCGRNKTGKNQYAPAPKLEDVADLIRGYHEDNARFKYTDYIDVFAKDHGINIGQTKLKAYLKELGLSTSSRGNHKLQGEKDQIILDELANDPLNTRGPRTVKEALELAGHKISRDDIERVMRDFHPEAFAARHPCAKKKKIDRQPLMSVGPDEEWSMDGHDKLSNAGFGIYGIRDVYTGRFLHYRVLPSNRYAAVVGVVFLECAVKRKGVCIQGSSDHGSETRDAYAFQTSLRETFAPDLLHSFIPSWQFLPSPRNITIESGWRPLFYTWGVNILHFYNQGRYDGFFEAGNVLHEQTSKWIWFPVIQRSLDKFCDQQNNHRVRKQVNKLNPSGGTPNNFYNNPEKWGGKPCLIPVDPDVLQHLLDNCDEGHRLMRYVDEEFEELAETAYSALNRPQIDEHSAWVVFHAMIGQLLQM